MSEINTTKQETPFGCFMNCFGMAKSFFEDDYSFSKEDEIQLLKESFEFDRECYEPYLISKLMEDYSVKVTVESEYLVWKYGDLSSDLENDIDPTHEIISVEDYKESVENGVAIVLMDKWYIDMYTHFAHWVVVSDYRDGKFIVNDSWTGKEIKMAEDKFEKSVESLKETLLCSPVLIDIQE